MRNQISNNGNDVECDWLALLVVPDTSSSNISNNKEETISLENIAARSSLILALARPVIESSSSKNEGEMEVVASVELRLQPTDAKIPFSQPWLDKFERNLARLISFAKDTPSPITTKHK